MAPEMALIHYGLHSTRVDQSQPQVDSRRNIDRTIDLPGDSDTAERSETRLVEYWEVCGQREQLISPNTGAAAPTRDTEA